MQGCHEPFIDCCVVTKTKGGHALACERPCLRGNCTPNQKLACFVHYLKIINTFFAK